MPICLSIHVYVCHILESEPIIRHWGKDLLNRHVLYTHPHITKKLNTSKCNSQLAQFIVNRQYTFWLKYNKIDLKKSFEIAPSDPESQSSITAAAVAVLVHCCSESFYLYSESMLVSLVYILHIYILYTFKNKCELRFCISTINWTKKMSLIRFSPVILYLYDP